MSEEFCDCSAGITVFDNGDGITRHSGCGKPHFPSYLQNQIAAKDAEIERERNGFVRLKKELWATHEAELARLQAKADEYERVLAEIIRVSKKLNPTVGTETMHDLAHNALSKHRQKEGGA